jgi:hypothetical protein
MLHEECRACRSTVYSFCSNNWLVVTLFIVSISRTDSTQFHQQAEWRLWCKRTRVQKTQLQASKPDIHIFFSMTQQPPVGRGLLIIEASRSQTHHTRHDSSGRVISPTQRPLPDNTQHSHPCPVWIRSRNPSKRAAAEPRLGPRGHWGRPEIHVT